MSQALSTQHSGVPARIDLPRNGHVAAQSRIGRGCLVWLGRIVAVLVGLSLVGALRVGVRSRRRAGVSPARPDGRRGRLSPAHQLRRARAAPPW